MISQLKKQLVKILFYDNLGHFKVFAPLLINHTQSLLSAFRITGEHLFAPDQNTDWICPHSVGRFFIFVLILAETDLIFFMVFAMMLYFGFSRKTMLITHGCFSCCCAVLHRDILVFQVLILTSQQGESGAQ